jgi:carbon storage regulator
VLVLSRNRNEWVEITTDSGERVKLCVVEIVNDRVKLGFVAPRSVEIHRAEVAERIAAGETPRRHP